MSLFIEDIRVIASVRHGIDMSKFELIVLLINVMHVNQIPFLVLKLYHINYYHVCSLDNLKVDCISRVLKGMYAKYLSRGGKVARSEADNTFLSI